jgi:hypothetical protein
MFHVAVQPAGLACVRCACFEVAERDGIWAGGEVAQPRKAPPDLGTQPFTMPQRSPSVNIHTDARTRHPLSVCLRIAHSGCDTVILRPYRPPVHGPYEIAVSSSLSQMSRNDQRSWHLVTMRLKENTHEAPNLRAANRHHFAGNVKLGLRQAIWPSGYRSRARLVNTYSKQHA